MGSYQRKSISRVGFDCQKHFVALEDAIASSDDQAVHGVTTSAVNDELGRFRIWAGNIGALSVGRGSLDYRLRDADYLHTNVISLLEDLKETLHDGLLIEGPFPD